MKPKRSWRELEHTVTAIQQRWGNRAIHRASEPDTTDSAAIISTGFPEVDRALRIGGLSRGRIIELLGCGTAGHVTLAARTLHQAQQAGQQVVYVDVEHAVDPQMLAHCGVRLSRLIVLRPHHLAHAAQMTTDLLKQGGAGVVVFDRLHDLHLLADGDAAHRLDQAWREWTPLLGRSLCTLLVLMEMASPGLYPEGLSLSYFASVRLAFEQQEWLLRRGQVVGYATKVTVLKNKMGPAGQAVPIQVLLDRH